MSTKPHEALRQIIDLLEPLNDDDRGRTVRSMLAFLGMDDKLSPNRKPESAISGHTDRNNSREPIFSGHEELSPKAFLAEKEPQTDIERVACLAYYLVHYRDMKYFKTLDISSLNTDAAQKKFSNPTNATNNALRRGFLADAPEKQKQLSAVGEQYVDALPDMQAAKAILEKQKRYLRRKPKQKKTATHK